MSAFASSRRPEGVPVEFEREVGRPARSSCWPSERSRAWASRFSLRLAPETLSTLARRFSSVPNCWSSVDAVLRPMPGTPGTLSTASPVRREKSTTWSGAIPQSALSPSTSRTLSLRKLRMRVRSSRSWRASLSAVQMTTSSPARRPAGEGGDHVVGLEPGVDQDGDARTPRTSRRITAICGRRSSGIAARWPCSRRTARSGRRARRRRTRRRGSRACGR